MKQETTPSPSIPVKDELFTNGTWVLEERNKAFYIEAINTDGEETTAVEICKLHGDENIDLKDAKAICTAVNNTYGKGLNPESISNTMATLETVLSVLTNWNTALGDGKYDNLIDYLQRTLQNAKLNP